MRDRLRKWLKLAFPSAFVDNRNPFTDHGTLVWATEQCRKNQFMVGTVDPFTETKIIAVEVARYPGPPRLRWRKAYGVRTVFAYNKRPELPTYKGDFMWLPK